MRYIEEGNPFTDPPLEFECMECGKPLDHPGYCSYNCAAASML